MGSQSELVNASGTLSDAELPEIELFKEYPDGLLKFATISSLIIMLIGIPGNIITIVALSRYKKVRNATAIFIINLSCSDLIFCFKIPFAISVFHHRAWIHGQILCQISIFTRYTLFFNSLFTIIAITINRYIMIAHPKSYTETYKKRNVINMLVCSWMFSFASAIPIIFEIYGSFNFDAYQGSCSILRDPSKGSFKKVIFLTAFILPCIIIIFCYSRIFCIVRKAIKKTSRIGKRGKLLNPEESSSADLSTSVSEFVTGEKSCNYMSDQIKSIKMSSNNKNTIDRFTEMKRSGKILRQSEKLGKEPQRLHRTALNKSIKLLKMALPTRKDKRLGTMIIAIMISFCLCHLPITIIKVFLENMHPKFAIAAHILFFLSFSVNPIIYVVMSNEYRKAYKNVFKRRKTCLSSSKTKI